MGSLQLFFATILGEAPIRTIANTFKTLLSHAEPQTRLKGTDENAQSYATAEVPEPLIIFILGPPGAGKGTQSASLKAAFPGFTHLSYGDLVRYQDGIPGSWVSSFPRRGNGSSSPLLPADAAVRLLGETIEAGVGHGQLAWLVDGFPRTEEHVAAWSAARMPPARCALHLSCPPETLVRRVLARSSGRPDDAVPELVRERVERNARESEALLQALADSGVSLIRVDSDRDVGAVKGEVLAHAKQVIDDWWESRGDVAQEHIRVEA
ncbi:hypothetical protein DL762_000298 [Monosporascus cannonballus]|uniref:Adenylate kinase active site lid domain-containing protein n=1 Tax=Monosporascus cannonballus TaxID=155416 RepID=A0ABY0HJC9_9PEZI|nr:hypothetical protein DL762_000298 [Monosporascus cannonballus]